MEGIDLYILFNVVFLLDLWDLLMRLYWRMRHLGPKSLIKNKTLAFPTSFPLGLRRFTGGEKKRRLKPYAIVASVHNAEGYLREFFDGLGPCRDRLFVVDDCSTDGTYRIIEEYGVPYIRNETNLKKPASIQKALRELPADVETVLVMDPDSRVVESGLNDQIADLEEVIADFQMSGADGCAVRILIRSQEGDPLLVKLQDLEYRLCISLGRKSLLNRTVLSGIAVYRRSSLEAALQKHPLSVYAEDFMTSLLILNDGGSIYYDGRLLVETEAKRTWKGLFSQRIGWDFGYIMTYFHVLARSLKGKDRRALLLGDRRPFIIYNYVLYLGLFGILMHPVKLANIGLLSLSFANAAALLSGLPLPFKDPALTPLWFIVFYLQYLLLFALIVHAVVEKKRRTDYCGIAFIFPLYSISLLLIRTVGFLNYFTFRWFGKKVYHDHF